MNMSISGVIVASKIYLAFLGSQVRYYIQCRVRRLLLGDTVCPVIKLLHIKIPIQNIVSFYK